MCDLQLHSHPITVQQNCTILSNLCVISLSLDGQGRLHIALPFIISMKSTPRVITLTKCLLCKNQSTCTCPSFCNCCSLCCPLQQFVFFQVFLSKSFMFDILIIHYSLFLANSSFRANWKSLTRKKKKTGPCWARQNIGSMWWSSLDPGSRQVSQRWTLSRWARKVAAMTMEYCYWKNLIAVRIA